MLFLKRLLTALVLLGVLFVTLRTASLMVGGAVMGAKASTELQRQRGPGGKVDFQESVQIGAEAGIKFRQDYGQPIGLGALGVATVGALSLAFGGLLPWCREQRPPPLPGTERSPR